MTETKKVSNEDKLLAALAYVSVLCIVPLVLKQDNEYVQFHAKQGLVVFALELIGMALLITLLFAAVTPVIWILSFCLSGYGFVSALVGKQSAIPGAAWVIKTLNI